MSPTIAVLMLCIGLAMLIAGAEILIRGAVSLAAAAKVSPLVIGLTVVAFGTSSPELAVSVQAALTGQPDIAIGNVIGSNIFNVLAILGLSSVIVPLVVAPQLIRFDVPLMIGLSIAVYVLALDGSIGRLDGLLFVIGLVAYTSWVTVQSRRERRTIEEEYAREFGIPTGEVKVTLGGLLARAALVAIGLAFLVPGSRWFTQGAVSIASALGLSDLVIGITIIAVGTSLPEIATSVLAAIRGERDIAVGNAVGSNIFNILSVLGITAVVSPQGIPVAEEAMRLDLPVMIAVAVACLPIFFTSHCIARWEGALFLGYYVAYTAYLVMEATEAPLRHAYVTAMLGFVLPLTTLTLLISVWRAWRRGARSDHGVAG